MVRSQRTTEVVSQHDSVVSSIFRKDIVAFRCAKVLKPIYFRGAKGDHRPRQCWKCSNSVI